jgi:hypothetical protein
LPRFARQATHNNLTSKNALDANRYNSSLRSIAV